MRKLSLTLTSCWPRCAIEAHCGAESLRLQAAYSLVQVTKLCYLRCVRAGIFVSLSIQNCSVWQRNIGSLGFFENLNLKM